MTELMDDYKLKFVAKKDALFNAGVIKMNYIYIYANLSK